jgi:hypothetical protein
MGWIRALLVGSVLLQGPSRGEGPAVGPSAVLVTSELELRAAAARCARQDLNILVNRKITIRRGITFPESRHIVRLIGLGEEAGIHINMVFNGNYADPRFRAENGLTFNTRQAHVRGLTFSGFEWDGAALKSNCAELFEVSRCRFRDIGTRQYAPRVSRPRRAEDTLYNQCIEAHEMRGGHISITNNRFERCAWSQPWSHCVYVDGRSAVVADNVFSDCGSALRVGGRGQERFAVVVWGNRIERPHPVPDPKGAGGMIQPYICDPGENYSTVFAFNVVEGAFSTPWTGAPRPERHFIDFNDYGEMRLTVQTWAADTKVGRWISWEQWRSMGFDVNSRTGEQTKP